VGVVCVCVCVNFLGWWVGPTKENLSCLSAKGVCVCVCVCVVWCVSVCVRVCWRCVTLTRQSSVERRVVGQPVTHASTWLHQLPASFRRDYPAHRSEPFADSESNSHWTGKTQDHSPGHHSTIGATPLRSTQIDVEATDQLCCRQVTNHLAQEPYLGTLFRNWVEESLPSSISRRHFNTFTEQ
jgi:hypothetical protein